MIYFINYMAIPTSISFDSFSLQSSTYIVRTITHRQVADRILNTKPNLRRGSFDIVDTRFTQKIITVNGWIKSDNATNLRTVIDNMKENIHGKEKNLDIDYGDGTIRYKATFQSIDIQEEAWYISQVPFTIEFLCEPWGTTPTTSSQSYLNKTTATYSDTINVTGSFGPFPTLTIDIDSETDMTVIKFQNNTTEDWVQIDRSFSAGESLVIDCSNETIQVDGTNVDFTGVFPEFNPNSNSFTMTITDSGAFQYDLKIAYNPHYL